MSAAASMAPEFPDDDFNGWGDGDIDVLSRICPSCGQAAEYPDCAACGHLFDTGTQAKAPPERLRIAFVRCLAEPAISEHQALTWPDLSAWLSVPDERSAKDGPGWMPADIEVWRNSKNAGPWCVLTLDIEGATRKADGIKTVIGPEPPPIMEALTEAELCGWRAIGHTSHSHRDPGILPAGVDHHRYRLVFAVTRPVQPDEIKPLGLHVASRLGLRECLDTGALESARFFYLPACPPERRALFEHGASEGEPIDVDAMLAEAKREADALKRATQAQVGRAKSERGKVIEAFNAAHDIGALLEAHGYQKRGRGRWLWSESSSGTPGVVLLPESDPQRIFSHHGGDPLADGHAHDAFDCWRILQGHGDDYKKAVREAARLLGMDHKPDAATVDMAEFLDRIRGEASGGADRANDAEPESESEAEPETNAEPEQPKRIFTMVGDLIANPRPPAWLVEDVLEEDTLALVYGPPKKGKSFVVIDWMCSIATGTTCHAHPVKQVAVFYICGEGHNGLARRFLAWSLGRGVSLAGAPIAVSKRALPMTHPGAAAAVSEAVEELRVITGTDPGLIIVDTLARNFGANENDTEAMSMFIAHLDEIRAPFKATALIVHHSGKDETRGARGSTVLFGAIDASYVVTRDELGMVSLTPEAMKDSALPPAQVFGMTPVSLPIESPDGREVTSCVLTLFGADYAPPQRGKTGRGKNQTRALMHLNRLYEQHRDRVERSGRDPDEARVLVVDWRAACLDDGIGANRWPETLASLKSADLVSVEGIYARPL